MPLTSASGDVRPPSAASITQAVMSLPWITLLTPFSTAIGLRRRLGDRVGAANDHADHGHLR
jgi:hypothetical protein